MFESLHEIKEKIQPLMNPELQQAREYARMYEDSLSANNNTETILIKLRKLQRYVTKKDVKFLSLKDDEIQQLMLKSDQSYKIIFVLKVILAVPFLLINPIVGLVVSVAFFMPDILGTIYFDMSGVWRAFVNSFPKLSSENVAINTEDLNIQPLQKQCNFLRARYLENASKDSKLSLWNRCVQFAYYLIPVTDTDRARWAQAELMLLECKFTKSDGNNSLPTEEELQRLSYVLNFAYAETRVAGWIFITRCVERCEGFGLRATFINWQKDFINSAADARMHTYQLLKFIKPSTSGELSSAELQNNASRILYILSEFENIIKNCKSLEELNVFNSQFNAFDSKCMLRAIPNGIIFEAYYTLLRAEVYVEVCNIDQAQQAAHEVQALISDLTQEKQVSDESLSNAIQLIRSRADQITEMRIDQSIQSQTFSNKMGPKNTFAPLAAANAAKNTSHARDPLSPQPLVQPLWQPIPGMPSTQNIQPHTSLQKQLGNQSLIKRFGE